MYKQAFLDFEKTQNVDKDPAARNSQFFLLVIPCFTQGVFVGDKVLLAPVQNISTREAWAALVPSTTLGLVISCDVDPRNTGRPYVVHLEA